MSEHPAFVRARALPENIRHLFPKDWEEAKEWCPLMRRRALSMRVLVVAVPRVECAWSAYIDTVPGLDHAAEVPDVASHGTKLPENVARALFPEFVDVPYAE